MSPSGDAKRSTAKGRPIDGFTEKDASTLCGNSVRMKVSWGENHDVGRLSGKPVVLRFVMRDCKLYAFQFKPCHSERSEESPGCKVDSSLRSE